MEPFLGGQVSLLHAFIIFVVINEQLLNLNNRWARFLWCVFIASDFLSDYVDGSVVLEQQLQGGSEKKKKARNCWMNSVPGHLFIEVIET